MSLRLALVTLAVIALFSGVGFWIVIANVDPNRAGALGLTIFFTTLFFGLAATFTLIGTFVRVALQRQLAPVRHLGVALRQGVLPVFFPPCCSKASTICAGGMPPRSSSLLPRLNFSSSCPRRHRTDDHLNSQHSRRCRCRHCRSGSVDVLEQVRVGGWVAMAS